jgi:Uma2 family endonuclease
MAMVQISEPRLRPWTRNEFYQLMELGWFLGQNVELIRGEIIEMPNQKSGHYAGIDKAARCLEKYFAEGFWVRTQAPLALEQDTEPNPDISVVKGSRDDYLDHHPTYALLVVEVSDSTLRYDRGTKGIIYASGGITDYWIINLVDRRLEVFRAPNQDPKQVPNYQYGDVQTFGLTDIVCPLAAPEIKILVGDLFP